MLAFYKIAYAGSKGSFAEARAQQSWGGRHQARTKGEPGRPVIPVLSIRSDPELFALVVFCFFKTFPAISVNLSYNCNNKI
jgi:hypothetical protein